MLHVGQAGRSRCPRAQPAQHLARASPRQADRLHRPVRLGQVLARLRHDLRRGPAPLRRVAVGLRPPVPGPDGQARRRLHRGPVAGHLDRPEVGVAQPPLDGRHHHRDLRLPAAALRPDRRAALPRRRHRRPAPDARSRSSTASWSCPTAPASRCWRRSCGAARASTRACSRSWPARASPGSGSTARSTSSPTRPKLARYEQHTIEVVVDRLVKREGIERRLTDSLETALRLAEGVAEVQLVPREGEALRRGDRSPSPSTWPARRAACRSTSWPPATSRFNSPYGACPHCDGLGTRFEVDPELVVPDPDLSVDEGAITPWGGGAQRVLHPGARGGRRGLRLLHRHARGGSSRRRSRRSLLYGVGTKQVHVQYRNRYGRTRSYDTHYEGVMPYLQRRHSEAESRLGPREHRGLHARGALPGVRRGPAQAGVAGGHRRRPQHRRALRPVDPRGRPRPGRRSSCPSATT